MKKYTKEKIIQALVFLDCVELYTIENSTNDKETKKEARAMLSSLINTLNIKPNKWGSMSESINNLKGNAKYLKSKKVKEIINNI